MMGAARMTQRSLNMALSVLNTLRVLYQSGQTAEQALRNAIEKTRKDFGVTYAAVRDACTRGLGLGVDEFKELAMKFAQGDPSALIKTLSQRTQDFPVHTMVQEILNVRPVAYGLGAIGLSITATKDVPGTTAFTFRLQEEHADHLRAIAKRERTDVAALLGRLVRDFIHQKTREELTEQFSHLSPDEQQRLLKALQAQAAGRRAAQFDEEQEARPAAAPRKSAPRKRAASSKPKAAAKAKAPRKAGAKSRASKRK